MLFLKSACSRALLFTCRFDRVDEWITICLTPADGEDVEGVHMNYHLWHGLLQSCTNTHKNAEQCSLITKGTSTSTRYFKWIIYFQLCHINKHNTPSVRPLKVLVNIFFFIRVGCSYILRATLLQLIKFFGAYKNIDTEFLLFCEATMCQRKQKVAILRNSD